MSTPVVIYHAGCADGFTSAWVLERCFKGAELIPAKYGDEPPEIDGRTVVVVDFSYPRDVLERMDQYAHRLIVLDHHKTAAEQLRGLRYATFDMDESGASLALQFANSSGLTTLMPIDSYRDMETLVAYVKDRDLWLHREPGTHEVNAVIRSYDFDLDTWDRLATWVGRDLSSVIKQGEAILRYKATLVDQHVSHATGFNIGGAYVPFVECTPGDIISDVLQKLAVGQPFAASYFRDNKNNIVVSLRSEPNGWDVGEVAMSYGGGGHKHAAGFRVPSNAINFEGGWIGQEATR